MPDVTAPPRFTRAPASPDPLFARVQAALLRSQEFFRDRRSAAGLVARRLLGRAATTDDELADHLIRERRRKSRMDGSINGSLVDTARAAWELLELGAPLDHAGVVRLTGFLLSRQDAPGRWGEASGRGAGFFSPGPAAAPIAPLALSTGVVVERDDDARFAASCIALRSVLRAGMDERTRVRTHVEALLDLRDLSPAMEVMVLGSVGLAAPDFGPRITELTGALVSRQGEDGTWADVPLFHALEALSSLPTPAARDGVRAAAPALLDLQRPSGAFDDGAREDLALVGVRALAAVRPTVR